MTLVDAEITMMMTRRPARDHLIRMTITDSHDQAERKPELEPTMSPASPALLEANTPRQPANAVRGTIDLPTIQGP